MENTVEAKTLHNSEASGTRVNVPDVKFFGDGDTWQLICKASSDAQGWMKSTKAMQVHNGCILQVTTQQRNPDGSSSLAEAITFVPDVRVCASTDDSGAIIGRYLMAPPPRG
jgi:hypothetical protein